MIRITLYRDCILNDGYKNEFSHNKNYGDTDSPFTAYLNSLTKQVYEIDNVYQDDMTMLNFKLKNNDYNDIYLFNYMKIESLNINNAIILTRYAFIDRIKIGNDIAQIRYKIDVWNTYISNTKGINISYLKGLRVLNGKGNVKIPEFYKLPIDYAGNNIPNFGTPRYNENSPVCIILQFQYYETQTLGVSSVSWTNYSIIRRKVTIGEEEENGWPITGSEPIYFREVDEIIKNIISHRGSRDYYLGGFGKNGARDFIYKTNFYFDLGNVYILPYDNFTNLGNEFQALGGVVGSISSVSATYRILLEACNSADYYTQSIPERSKLAFIKKYTYNNNFKRKSIGILSYQVPVENNGSTIDIDVYVTVSCSSFRTFISIQNKFYDITENFKYTIPLEQISGENIAQQKISKELADRNNTMNLIQNIASGYGGLVSSNADIDYNQNRITYASTERPNVNSMLLNTAMAGLSKSEAGFYIALINTGVSLVKFFANRQKINARAYNSSSLVLANDCAIINAKFWIFDINITSDNDNYVKETINNIGYNVYEYIKSLLEVGFYAEPQHFVNWGIYYNVIQFGSADIYGSFPLEIAKQLNQILENGVKIWYHHNIDYALNHDTYAVG